MKKLTRGQVWPSPLRQQFIQVAGCERPWRNAHAVESGHPAGVSTGQDNRAWKPL